MRKLLLALFPLLSLIGLANISFAQTQPVPVLSDIEVVTNNVPHHLSFLFPLSYQAGPGQTIKICGKISVPKNSPTYAVMDLYTKIECQGTTCSELFDKKEVEYHGIIGGISTGKPKSVVSSDRYPPSGYITYQFSPGDYLEICWYLHVRPDNSKEGKVRAYFYAKEIRFNIVREKYSDWITIKMAQPVISGWDVNILIYGGLALLVGLAALLKFKS